MSGFISADLSELDEQQRAAAETLRGPVLIRAGAGTGKTRTITHRIAHGVKTGTYSPDRVMALSFTKKAAGELQERLHRLGVIGAKTSTFHSAALQQLKFFWEDTVGGSAPRIISSKTSFLSELLKEFGLSLDPESMRDLSTEIEWRKVSMLKFSDYEAKMQKRPHVATLSRAQTLEIMEAYENKKHENRAIDFEDVLLLMTGMLADEPRVAAFVRERYRFFTVDEYQDISPLQHSLLKAWLGERNNVCVVGDAAQTIYSFAGASSSYLHDFSREYPEAREFRLEMNYRSTPEIIQLANNLMKNEPGALNLSPVSQKSFMETCCEWFSDSRAEASAIAAAVKQKLVNGVKAKDVAVLFRSNGYGLDIQEAFAQEGILTRFQTGIKFFDRPEVKRAVLEIRAQALAGDTRPVFQIVSDVIRGQGWTSKHPAADSPNKEKWEVLNTILGLVDESPDDIGIKEFSDDLMRRADTDHEPELNFVTLATIHSAKGLEWDYVWVAGVAEGMLPIGFTKGEAGIAEEKRLFYVAITRAKKEIYFSGFGKDPADGSRFLQDAKIPVCGS